MARRRRNSLLEDLLEGLFEATGMFWQFGVAVTLAFFGGGIYSLIDAINYQAPAGALSHLLNEQLGWIHYLLPAVLFFLSFIFGIKTYSTYREQNYY